MMQKKGTNQAELFKRRIRSFVRREGRMTSSQRRALETLWPRYGLSIEKGMIDFEVIFGRTTSCVLEIGFGMGETLLSMAAENSNTHFMGIEVYRPGVGSLLSRLEKLDLQNVRVYCVDAVDVLQKCILDNSLDKVLLYFPDPWPKKRHYKRRLLNEFFVDLVCAKLKENGRFEIATDWENYAVHMMQILSQARYFVNIAGKDNYSERPHYRLLTKFEKRGQKLGHRVWDLVFAKNSKQTN